MLFEGLKIVVVALCCLAASVRCVRVFQAERYQMPVYSQWLRRNRDRYLKDNLLIGFMSVPLSWYLPILLSLFLKVETARNALAGWLMLLAFAGVTGALAAKELHVPAKKRMVLTMRARRLFGVLTLEYLGAALLLNLLTIPPYLTYALIPYAVWLAGRIMDPIEAKINAGFFNEARRKLHARSDLIVIGITGSYGKTFTKFILRELLSQKYEVLATPASFNTAMGISRVINDSLEDKHQVFIAEMGAQHVGDIRQLVKLTRPRYGVITSIGPQHLDSFGSMANVLNAKYELVEGLPKDGAAFFAADSGYIDRLYSQCPIEKYNAAVEQPGSYSMYASDVSFDANGTKFLLQCADGGRARCRTRLLGRYNVQNIALAAAVAHRMGLTMEEIAAGISRLQPFEKKLQMIPGERIVIDDTLNVTASGAAEALNVLAELPGRRIIVTPGLPESAADSAEDVNYAFGTQIPGCADAVILVGERAKVLPIAKGVRSKNFPKNSIHFVADMDDAEDLLREISDRGDTILYESNAEE